MHKGTHGFLGLLRHNIHLHKATSRWWKDEIWPPSITSFQGVFSLTEVHSDDLASHRQTDQRINNRSAHQMIVHRLNYVGPVTMGLTPKKSNPAGTV